MPGPKEFGLLLTWLCASCTPAKVSPAAEVHIPSTPAQELTPSSAQPQRKPLPQPPGPSCENVLDSYVETQHAADSGVDLSAGAYGAVLNRGSYVSDCRAPHSMTVNICTAILGGRALGVTVHTVPPDPVIEDCIDRRVRALEFPYQERLDVTRTVFQGL